MIQLTIHDVESMHKAAPLLAKLFEDRADLIEEFYENLAANDERIMAALKSSTMKRSFIPSRVKEPEKTADQ